MTSFTLPFSAAAPTRHRSWQRLQALAAQGQPHLRELLHADADASTLSPNTGRSQRLQLRAAGLRLDARHQAVTPEVLDALLDLAADCQIGTQAQALCRGEPVNATEGRAVLHPALRAGAMANPPWGAELAQRIEAELGRFLAAAERIRSGHWLGHSGQRITDVVNLGIGGSDLGPRMAVTALESHVTGPVRVHFVSNPDAWALHRVLRPLDAARTVFIVQSKTFTTQETLTLAASARRWLHGHGLQTPAQQAPHLIAVTAAPAMAAQQGYRSDHTFGFWDWVGGRYSVWSAIGLPLAIAIGPQAFREFLQGGHAMDQHFWSAQAAHNMPLLMALLGIWNRNFLHCPTHMLAPYPSQLDSFTRFVQQLDMESNGKSTHLSGEAAQVPTGPIVWGGLGIDGQHAYFQLLHQGCHRVPVDFIGVEQEDTPLPLAAEHHRVVLLNLRAQALALAVGRDRADTEAELRASGLPEPQVQALWPHRRFAGNVPNSTLWLPALTPHALGALVALYEHKVFCQAAIWGINAYDQWGVELGKTLAKTMEQSHSPA
ncbi:glucose-6-phosphate isomerase [Serpentinimonas barnesii]|uniref:glucose-6-phosphate isomerase n=1 Tax=Serpentinimonas barnesii TaxID=1458427 RepID=UPI0005F0AFA5|nr:glucose-6-phosphate isomerase [Serpentinimonas barnesii]